SANHPIAGAPVYVSFSSAAGSTGTDLEPEDPNTSGFCGAAIIHSAPVLCFTRIGVSRTPDLKLSYTSSSPTVPNGGADTITAALDTSGSGAVTDTYSYGRQTTLTYTGATSGDFNDPATLSATLVEQGGSVPVQGALVSFALDNSETCTGTTNASGR